jgi:hypothetical protein
LMCSLVMVCSPLVQDMFVFHDIDTVQPLSWQLAHRLPRPTSSSLSGPNNALTEGIMVS